MDPSTRIIRTPDCRVKLNFQTVAQRTFNRLDATRAANIILLPHHAPTGPVLGILTHASHLADSTLSAVGIPPPLRPARSRPGHILGTTSIADLRNGHQAQPAPSPAAAIFSWRTSGLVCTSIPAASASALQVQARQPTFLCSEHCAGIEATGVMPQLSVGSGRLIFAFGADGCTADKCDVRLGSGGDGVNNVVGIGTTSPRKSPSPTRVGPSFASKDEQSSPEHA